MHSIACYKKGECLLNPRPTPVTHAAKGRPCTLQQAPNTEDETGKHPSRRHRHTISSSLHCKGPICTVTPNPKP